MERPSRPVSAATIIATVAFAGYLPVAPGTAGALVGLCILLIPGFSHPAVLIPAILIGFAAGVITAESSSTPGNPDPSEVVIDELVGMWIAAAFLPLSLTALAAAFILFRLFDIVKPFPARDLERLKGGWGIMMDDVAAGVYANLATRLLLFLVPALT